MSVWGVMLLLLFQSQPFWEAAEPSEWTNGEIQLLLTDSPWVSRQSDAHIYLASAKPVREAELERWNRLQGQTPDAGEFPASEEYLDFIRENGDDYLVVAVHIPFPRYLLKPRDTKAMENKSLLVVGKEKHKLVGHFPPTPSDRYLRMVFPRVEMPAGQEFLLKLYVPGVPKPYRMVYFNTARLMYRGSPEW